MTRIGILGAATAVVIIAAVQSFALPAWGQSVSDDRILFEFDGRGISIERKLLREQPSPRRHSREEWNSVTRYKMEYGQAVDIFLAPKDNLSQTLPCGSFFKSALLKYRRPVNFPIKFSFASWPTASTENPYIVRFVPPPGESSAIEHFEIQSPDPRDYRGEPQRFSVANNVFPDAPTVVTMSIEPSPDIELVVRLSSKECFIREALAIARYSKEFIATRERAQ